MRYRYKNLFHVDEMGMFHDISPDEVPLHSGEYVTCKNGEAGQSRVTILLCCNASGSEKFPPVICGRSEGHPALDNKCQYYTNQNAWLTPDNFKFWLSQLNTQMSQLNRQILLMLNRTWVHNLKETVLSNVSLVFFPKDFPSDLQPLRANIFHYVKMMYRRGYAKKMLQPNFNWTLTDTISSIVNAWDDIPEEFVLSSFRRTNFRSDNNLLQISCPEWEDLDSGVSFRSFVTFDDNLSVSNSSRTRSPKRLVEVKPARNSATCCAPGGSRSGGYHKPIELEDSCSDKDSIEEISSIPSTSKFNSDFLAVSSHDKIAGQLRRGENGDADSISENLQSGKDHGDLTQRVEPLTETVFLYMSDIVDKTVQKTMPDTMELTSGLARQRVIGDVVNRRGIEENDDSLPIRRKRCREETDVDDASNDTQEPTEKKKTEEQAWSDVYEHNFVFGAPASPRGTTSNGEDVQTALVHPTINSKQKNDDLEKKSIFTICHASSSRTQN